MFLIGRFGRKTLVLAGEISIFVDFAALGLAPYFFSDVFYISVVCLSLFMVFFQLSLGSVLWVYCSEIMNDRGLSFANCISLFSSFSVVLMFPLLKEFIGIKHIFLIYSGIMLLGSIYTAVDMFETRTLTRVEIVRYVQGSNSQDSLRGSFAVS